MSDMAFICDKDLASLFESFGIDTFMLKDRENPRNILRDLVKKGYGIVYILERFAADHIDMIDRIRKESRISVVLVPDHIMNRALGMSLVKLASRDAIGTDAVFVKKEG